MMNSKIFAVFLLLVGCVSPKKLIDIPSNLFPVVEEKAAGLPPKENFYIFILAGQSNMAGRGFVQPDDTLTSPHVLALNKNNEWVLCKRTFAFL